MEVISEILIAFSESKLTNISLTLLDLLCWKGYKDLAQQKRYRLRLISV